MTPFELEVLMHHHISSAPFPRQSETYDETISKFVMGGICETTKIGGSPKKVTILPKGEKWIEMILSTPMPTMMWVDPRFQEREDGENA